jgi:hypothetical protein
MNLPNPIQEAEQRARLFAQTQAKPHKHSVGLLIVMPIILFLVMMILMDYGRYSGAPSTESENYLTNAITVGILLLLGGWIYFLPSLVANSHGHHNTSAIFILNLFLGWTVLGWVVALVWAFTKQK